MNDTFVDTAELIDRFRTFAGIERYRNFLYVTNTNAVDKRRLLHWQEQLWQGFCDDHPKYVRLTSDELLGLFRICHIHEQELLDDRVPAVYGHWRFPQDYLTALEQSFPFANLMYCGDNVERQRHVNQDVKYCPACREALLEWNADRKNKIGMP